MKEIILPILALIFFNFGAFWYYAFGVLAPQGFLNEDTKKEMEVFFQTTGIFIMVASLVVPLILYYK